MIKRILVLLVAVVFAITGTVSAVPASADPPQSDTPKPPDDALAIEEPLDDAIVVEKPLDDAFILDLRDDPNFSGAWVDEDRTLHLAFLSDPGPLGQFKTDEKLQLHTGRTASFTELQKEQQRIEGRKAGTSPISTYIDEISGELVVEAVLDAKERSGDLDRLELSVPHRIVFVDRTEAEFGHGAAKCTSRNDCDYIGADLDIWVSTNVKSSGCSSGGIYKVGSNYYLLTAAHCGGFGATSGTVSHNGYIIGDFHATSWASSYVGDTMSFKLRQGDLASRHLNTDNTGGYVDIASWDSSVTVGEQVCVNSQYYTTFDWNCGTVSSVSHNIICGGVSMTGLIRSDTMLAGFGDSGSAVWGNGQHRGVFNCFQPLQNSSMIPPSRALADLGASLSNGHKSYKPHSEIRNRNFEGTVYWSDWLLGGSGQRAVYSAGYANARATEFNCFTAGCSVYQDTPSGLQGYNPGEKFRVETWVKCTTSPNCNTTLAMWLNPNSSAVLIGHGTFALNYNQWKKISITVTVPSGSSGGQARWELYNNSAGKNIRFSQPVWSRI